MEVYSFPKKPLKLCFLSTSHILQHLLSSVLIHQLYQNTSLCPSMESEEGEQSSHNNPYTEFEQDNSDIILAILQEQERTLTMLATIESESDDDQTDSSFDNVDANSFEGQEFEADLQFLEGEGSDDDDYEEMEEDDLDPDELSYEELIESGELIGEEKSGLSANEIPSCLHPYPCSPADSKTGTDRCVICQVEYEEGEALVALQCEHPYHTECISKWLQMKKVCPICGSDVSTPKMAKNLSNMQR